MGRLVAFVVRGGSFLDSPDLITSARRDENPFFDAQVGGEFKRRSMGFRIAVSTSSIPRDVSEVPRLETAFEETQRQVDGPLDEQPLQQMQAVAIRFRMQNCKPRSGTCRANCKTNLPAATS